MSPIRQTFTTMLFLILGLTMIASCGDPNKASVFDPGSGSHPDNWLVAGHGAAAKANQDSCVQCHGDQLSGGIAEQACADCHISGSPLANTQCTSCHANPPSGSAAPNRRGAHTIHTALPNLQCAACHGNAGSGTTKHFNGVADALLPAIYNAKSGTAAYNTDGTCSNVSCHGGQASPAWYSQANINTGGDCTVCHAYGTAQYNSFSGLHERHVVRANFECTRCHDTLLLGALHFSALQTASLEGNAAATIKSRYITSYANSTCVAICHNNQQKTW